MRLSGRIARMGMLVTLALLLAALLWPRADAYRKRRRAAKARPPPVPEEAPISLGEQSPPEEEVPPPQSVVPPSDSVCPVGMVLIEGEYCPSVAHRCLRFLGDDRLRCAKYAETSRCYGSLIKKRFCVDRYEYPSQQDAMPLLAVTWEQAKALCEQQAKRLCTASEWTLACEGPGRLPYPYGYERDPVICNIDKPYRFPDNNAYANPQTRAQEVARLDQREPSGSRSSCVSPYGVYDMTGNVDEWVLNEQGGRLKPPFISGLKGGYWGPVRNRCRPITDVHNMWHSGYQIGFRCCAEAAASAQTP